MKEGINCGSGQRPFHSTPEVHWLNVESVEKWKPDLLCDGAHLPHCDNTVDYFVLHHVLEHFGCGEAAGLIKEAHRVLRPGGSLLVFVPDLEALAKRWLAGGLSTQIYVTNLYGAYMGREEDRHKWGFDVQSLRWFLETGNVWTSVDMFDWRNVPGMDAARDFWIIGMEARK